MEITEKLLHVSVRCTRVASSTEFKPELNKSPFTKRQFFPFNEPIRLQLLINRQVYALNIIPTRFSESRFDKYLPALDSSSSQKTVFIAIGIYSLQTIFVAVFSDGEANDDLHMYNSIL